MSKEQTDLAACPFCSGAAVVNATGAPPSVWVVCTRCGATTAWVENNAEAAIDLWNRRRRASPSPAGGVQGVMPPVFDEIVVERARQVAKGWTPEHDDEHLDGELARAAAFYAVADVHGFKQDGWSDGVHGRLKPWPITPKPDRRANLVIATAMLIAEIERLDRVADAEVNRILTMPEDELYAEVRARGEDPHQVAERMREVLKSAERSGAECGNCGGRGTEDGFHPCPTCNGDGRRASASPSPDRAVESYAWAAVAHPETGMGKLVGAIKSQIIEEADELYNGRYDLIPLVPPGSGVAVRPLEEWHEDCGDVVWWCWRDGAWMGEPAYIGTPLDIGRGYEVTIADQSFVVNLGGWPGYHTHWTPHPDFPAALSSQAQTTGGV